MSGEKNPKAKRLYLVLGVIHAPLFGAILAREPFADGQYAVAGVSFLLAATLTMAVFYRLAQDHYHGNVPGKAGSLVYTGKDEDGGERMGIKDE